MMHFLLILSIVGIITSTMYALLVVVGALRLAGRQHPEASQVVGRDLLGVEVEAGVARIVP